ncbi:hypothetical protein KBI33_00740 [Candidatus Shapirobacteria bacterium]|nr:hypothetical protein [Candidatus Shapirobacteria bacterium]
MAEEETYLINESGENQETPKGEGREENFFSSPKGKIIAAVVAVVVIGLGVLTGKSLAKPGEKEIKTVVSGVAEGEEVRAGMELGLPDAQKTFKDSAIGVVREGGVDGEGTHHLEREGGPSQNVYLTSSTVDLSQLVNHKVQVWGETFASQKAGWFMDVVKVKVLE